MTRRTVPSTAAHPHQSRQSQTRAEKWLTKAAAQVRSGRWTAARYRFDRALQSDPAPHVEAFATIGRAACDAAIAAQDDDTLDPVAEYQRVEGELQHLVPFGGGA